MQIPHVKIKLIVFLIILVTNACSSTPENTQFAFPKVKHFMVPNDGQVYMQVKHDFETAIWDYMPRAYNIDGWKPELNPQGAFPDTFPCTTTGGSRERVRLTEPFQRLWFDLLKEASNNNIPEAILVERWAEITEHGRALTDFFAVQQGYRDHILQQNLSAKEIGILKPSTQASPHQKRQTLSTSPGLCIGAHKAQLKNWTRQATWSLTGRNLTTVQYITVSHTCCSARTEHCKLKKNS